MQRTRGSHPRLLNVESVPQNVPGRNPQASLRAAWEHTNTIIPQSQGTQAFDRYAYANNSPTRYTDPTGHGAYCGDDYDPGCLSDDEMPKYYRAVRHRTEVDLNTHHSPYQFAPEIVEDYGYNACGIVAGCAAGATVDEVGSAAVGQGYTKNNGIQPTKLEIALEEVYGYENVTAEETTLSAVTEKLDRGVIVIVDILIQLGGSDIAHFARVLGIDWGVGEIYLENTLEEGVPYLTVPLDQFEAMWLDPENRADNPAPDAELVNNWAVFIYP